MPAAKPFPGRDGARLGRDRSGEGAPFAKTVLVSGPISVESTAGVHCDGIADLPVDRGGVQRRRSRRFLPLSMEKIMTKVKSLARIRVMVRSSSFGEMLLDTGGWAAP